MKSLLTFAMFFVATLASHSQILINEVDADQEGTDAGEFVELYGPANTALDGYVVVFYNGNNDESYASYDLDGYTLNSSGFFVMGNPDVPNVELTFPGNGLQNGPDAVALYLGDGTDFPSNTALTATNLVDYMVYDTDDADDPELLTLLLEGGQLNENELGQGGTHSNSRVPDGGTANSTLSYTQQTPTPGSTNLLLCDAGSLTNEEMEDFEVCVEDELESTIAFGNTSLVEGDSYLYIITDLSGLIQFTSENGEIDFLGESIGQSLVWGVSYDGTLDAASLMAGEDIGDLSLSDGDCLSMTSEGIEVSKIDCSVPECLGGIAQVNGGNSAFLCTTDEDLEVFFSAVDASGDFDYQYVIADQEDNIVQVQSGDSFDFDGYGTGIWNIYGISYIGTLDEATIEEGDPVLGITAENCLSLSEGALVSVSECTDGCSDLFFSEYIEGSNSNKAYEIYNPKDVAVDLSEYTVNLYANGSSDVGNTITLEGTLDPGDVYIVANESAWTEILDFADITSTTTFYNGDDALELVHNEIVIDVIGVVGEDPGSSWVVGDGSTAEHTLVRMMNVNEGTADWTLGQTQWDVYDQNEFSYLGSHIANSCGSSDLPSVSFTTSSQSVEEGELVTVEVSFTNPLYDIQVTVEVDGGTATEIVDYDSSFPITIDFMEGSEDIEVIEFLTIDDSDEEEDETIVLTLTSETDDFQIITETQTITILDNDAVYDVYEIADVVTIDMSGEAELIGEEVELRGVVYGVNLRPGGLQFTLIDPTDGIGVFSDGEDFGYTVNEGDSLHITGVIDQFSGLTQIEVEGIDFISSDNALKEPTVVTDLNEITESDLVKFECVSLVDPAQWDPFGSGFNVEITDGISIWEMRIDNDVDLFSMDPPSGSFDLIGIGGQFDNSSPYNDGYQILPRYSEDIQAAVNMDFAVLEEDLELDLSSDCLQAGGDVGLPYNFVPDYQDGTSYEWEIEELSSESTIAEFSNIDFTSIGSLMEGENDVLLSLTITDENGCTSSIDTTICLDLFVGIEEFDIREIDLFPNPTTDFVYFNANSRIDQIVIKNSIGQIVESEIPASNNGNVDLSALSPGVYFFEIYSESEVFIEKVIKK